MKRSTDIFICIWNPVLTTYWKYILVKKL